VIADGKIASALTGKTYNGLTLTSLGTGFTIAGGTTSKTLTVPLDASVSGTNTGDQTITLTGDITGSGTGSFATTLANGVVTNTKLANMGANTIKGNNTGATGVTLDLTPTQLTAMLNPFSTTLKGLVPLSGGGTTNFLRADGTWALPAGSGGTVTSASVVSANGFSGTVATATTTPAITLSTSVNGIAKGNGTALSAAASGTDYSAGTSTLATGILKSITTTGALSIATPSDFPILNQNTTGNAATVTTNANLTGDVTSVGNATTLATVNPNVGTFNSVTVNAKGLVTSATITTSELTGKTNADANSTYPDNATYWSNVTTANGFPVNGNLSGIRKGTFNSQRVQDQLNGSTYARAWIEGTTSWTQWAIYLIKSYGQDFFSYSHLYAIHKKRPPQL
jgi:hypothetical protein